jgi:hypothetical protein
MESQYAAYATAPGSPKLAPRFAALVTDLAKIQAMKMVENSQNVPGGRPRRSVPA